MCNIQTFYTCGHTHTRQSHNCSCTKPVTSISNKYECKACIDPSLLNMAQSEEGTWTASVNPPSGGSVGGGRQTKVDDQGNLIVDQIDLDMADPVKKKAKEDKDKEERRKRDLVKEKLKCEVV